MPDNSSILATHTRNEAVQLLEKVLHDLLENIFALEKKNSETRARQPIDFAFRRLDIAKMLAGPAPTDLDILISYLDRQPPLAGALRIVIRNIGEWLYRIGGMDLMEDTANKVAMQSLSCLDHTSPGSDFGRQMSVLSSSWNGVGEWWS